MTVEELKAALMNMPDKANVSFIPEGAAIHYVSSGSGTLYTFGCVRLA